MQTWIMAGLASLIVVVILLTGNADPPAPSTTFVPQQGQPAPVAPEQIRTFQRELGDRERRLEPPPEPSPFVATVADSPPPARPAVTDPLADERRRREYDSLFADNVAYTTRAGAAPPPTREDALGQTPRLPLPSPQELAAFQQAVERQGSAGEAGSAAHPRRDVDPARQTTPEADTARTPSSATDPSAEETGGYRILEGTVIEAVLLNRLDGTFSGPVTCVVTTPVYSQDRQVVVIPRGARLLGSVMPVQGWGDTRLAVSFHRLLLPTGRTVSLEQFQGLNQVGETGLRDRVDRHYLQVFGASVAVGALAGLGQWGTRGGFNESFGDASRQSAGASLAASAARIMDRYLNVLPTITIREGHRTKVYLTNDLTLPLFAVVHEGMPAHGGVS
jgi:type IV secretion system protein TrbI